MLTIFLHCHPPANSTPLSKIFSLSDMYVSEHVTNQLMQRKMLGSDYSLSFEYTTTKGTKQKSKRSSSTSSPSAGWLLSLLREMDTHFCSFGDVFGELQEIVAKVEKLFQIGRHAPVDDEDEVYFLYDNDIARSYLDESKIYELQDVPQIDALISDPSFCLKAYCLQFIDLLKKWKEFGEELAKDDSSNSDVLTIVSGIRTISDKYNKLSNFSHPLIFTRLLSSCCCCCSSYYYLLGFTNRFLI